ncbi:hypothetical protein [Vibrio campbellii]|uniref:hypothetical protein n=1 Tax=Vibrio campbellii TaxID=680 RepID=UPI0037366AE6
MGFAKRAVRVLVEMVVKNYSIKNQWLDNLSLSYIQSDSRLNSRFFKFLMATSILFIKRGFDICCQPKFNDFFLT